MDSLIQGQAWIKIGIKIGSLLPVITHLIKVLGIQTFCWMPQELNFELRFPSVYKKLKKVIFTKEVILVIEANRKHTCKDKCQF